VAAPDDLVRVECDREAPRLVRRASSGL